MIVAGYTMDLYCYFKETQHHEYLKDYAQFYGKNAEDCKRDARKAGWKFKLINGELDAVCPACARM